VTAVTGLDCDRHVTGLDSDRVTMRTVTLCLVMVVTMVRSQQTKGKERLKDSKKEYWWLGPYLDRKSPFGGRNYNLEEIGRGEHIRMRTKTKKKRGDGGLRDVKKMSKRQTGEFDQEEEEEEEEEEIFEENEIKLNEIDTQCPRGSKCVETFFCKTGTGRRSSDRIPCLINSGDFAGDFGLCCTESFRRVCPRVPVVPPPEDCLPKNLGEPEAEECDIRGLRSNCSKSDLCCFNGCINICLEEPPYIVENAFFFRQKAIIVGRRKVPSDLDIEEEEDFERDEYVDEEDVEEKFEEEADEPDQDNAKEDEGNQVEDEESEFTPGESFSRESFSSEEKDKDSENREILSPKLRSRSKEDDLFSPAVKRMLLRLIRRLRIKRRLKKRKIS